MDPKAKVYDILNSFSTAMLVTVGPGNRPEARPMQLARVENQGNIWFITGKSGGAAREVERDPFVLLVFQNERSSYLSLRGRAATVEDKARVKEVWKETYKVWFPGGVDDPEITLISVEPEGAEYWDNRGTNKIEYMFEAARAYLKGEKPVVKDVDQHARTAL